jgi:hypothetical protein
MCIILPSFNKVEQYKKFEFILVIFWYLTSDSSRFLQHIYHVGETELLKMDFPWVLIGPMSSVNSNLFQAPHTLHQFGKSIYVSFPTLSFPTFSPLSLTESRRISKLYFQFMDLLIDSRYFGLFMNISHREVLIIMLRPYNVAIQVIYGRGTCTSAVRSFILEVVNIDILQQVYVAYNRCGKRYKSL